MNEFYVYVLFRPWDGSPFYVGKGKGQRWSLHEKLGDKHYNSRMANIVRKANRLGLEIPKVKIRTDLTELEAFKIEMVFIGAIGRADKGLGPLINLTDGGDGPSGLVFSKEAIAKISKKSKDNWANPEIREKIIRNHSTPESLFNIGSAMRNKTHTEESKLKMSISSARNKPWLGKHFSSDHCAKIGAKNKTKWQDPEYRKKMIEICSNPEKKEKLRQRSLGNTYSLGNKHSETTLAKIGAKTKLRWADPQWRADTIKKQKAGRANRKENQGG
jgi:hypothetical protein